jgi:hypothetical protein
MSCNAVIYARTSPDCTVSAEDQVDRLKTVAADHGWTVGKVIIDRPTTAKKDRRPGEMALIEAIRSGGVEKVLIHGAFHLRQMRRDRILRGQAAVRGIVRFGRPPIPPTRVEKAKQGLVAGKSIRQVAQLAGISPASVSRMKNSLVSASGAM